MTQINVPSSAMREANHRTPEQKARRPEGQKAMFNLENVLVVVDPYAANDHVLQRVRYLQRMDDFDVHLVSADYTQYLVEGYYFDSVELERLRREYLDERKEALEQIAETLRAMGLRVTTSAHWGHPAYRVIVDAVRDT